MAKPFAHPSAASNQSAEADPNPIEYIRSAYAVMDEAVARHDMDRVFAYCSPDFVQVSPGGRVSCLEDIRTEADVEIQHSQSAASKTLVRRIIVKGDCAVVNLVQQIWITGLLSNGYLQTLDGVENVRDNWVCVNHQWMLKKTTVLTEAVTLNGKHVPAQ